MDSGGQGQTFAFRNPKAIRLFHMSLEWYPLTNGVETGHLTYFLSSRLSELPIRRTEGGDYGHKTEPHYEDNTYGYLSCCVCSNRIKAVRERRKYMFFATQYQGLIQECRRRVYIVGYYNTTSYRRKQSCRLSNDSCVAIRGETGKFVGINEAFELTDDVWSRWFQRELPKTNGRPFVQGIVRAAYESGLGQVITRELLDYFKKTKNRTADFIRETDRISKQEPLITIQTDLKKSSEMSQSAETCD